MNLRDQFEQWYVHHFNTTHPFSTPLTLEKVIDMRRGETYGNYGYLNGCWQGFQAKAKYTGYMPVPVDDAGNTEMQFLLEGANEGEWAAYEYGCAQAEDAVRRVLDGSQVGAVVGSTWQALRDRLQGLMKDAERWQKFLYHSFAMPAGRGIAVSAPGADRESHDKIMNEWIDG